MFDKIATLRQAVPVKDEPAKDEPAKDEPAHRRSNDPDWAWRPYEPDDRRPWDLRRAGHLFRRAGFGADWGQLQQALADGPQQTVDRLLRGGDGTDDFNRTYDDFEAAAAGLIESLRAWWLRRMILTPHPLLEKMTLFFHGHFAVSNTRVNHAPLMQAHLQRLRQHALGDYRGLLKQISRDPAVLLGLDAAANRKGQPSEHFARTFLEAFTLGPNVASEQDVREAARAFTGWFVLRGRLRYIEREYDTGVKQIFGHEGNFAGHGAVDVLLTQPAASKWLVRKLYRWLIDETDEPGEQLIAPLAASFAEGYNVGRLVETMLRSNLFFSPAAYRRRVKGPVEYAVGIVRGFEAGVSTTQLAQDLAALGQDLFYPPTVKGWPGGPHWINASTLIARSNLARNLLSGAEPYGDKVDPMATAGLHGHGTAESAGKFLLDLFLQGDVPEGVGGPLEEVRSADVPLPQQVRRFAHAVVTLPEFHLA